MKEIASIILTSGIGAAFGCGVNMAQPVTKGVFIRVMWGFP